jgi:ectoine hydroxylase-related dioxygenase (phytanoyl-CoA dioxygenase family)
MKVIEQQLEATEVTRTYANDGYVIAKNVFSAGSLEAIRSSLGSVLSKGDETARQGERYGQPGSLNDLILRQEAAAHSIVYKASQSIGSSATAYQLLGGSKIFEEIAKATGFETPNIHLMPMYFIIQLPSDQRFDYLWHQDGTYYAWAKDMLTLWFPVNRATKKETGTISVISGSHLAGPRPTETRVITENFKQYESKLEKGEAERETVLELELGDCCIMHGNTVHRSVSNRSSTPRVAGLLRMVNIASLSSYDRERFYCVHKS